MKTYKVELWCGFGYLGQGIIKAKNKKEALKKASGTINIFITKEIKK